MALPYPAKTGKPRPSPTDPRSARGTRYLGTSGRNCQLGHLLFDHVISTRHTDVEEYARGGRNDAAQMRPYCALGCCTYCSQSLVVFDFTSSVPATGSSHLPTFPQLANTGPTLQAGIVKRGAIAWQLHSCDSISFLLTAPCASVCILLQLFRLSLWPQAGPSRKLGRRSSLTPARAALCGGVLGGGRFLPRLRASPRLSAHANLGQRTREP